MRQVSPHDHGAAAAAPSIALLEDNFQSRRGEPEGQGFLLGIFLYQGEKPFSGIPEQADAS